jgi:hypothetical protein
VDSEKGDLVFYPQQEPVTDRRFSRTDKPKIMTAYRDRSITDQQDPRCWVAPGRLQPRIVVTSLDGPIYGCPTERRWPGQPVDVVHED